MIARVGVDVLTDALRTLTTTARAVSGRLVLGVLCDLEVGDFVEEGCLVCRLRGGDVGCEDVGERLSRREGVLLARSSWCLSAQFAGSLEHVGEVAMTLSASSSLQYRDRLTRGSC